MSTSDILVVAVALLIAAILIPVSPGTRAVLFVILIGAYVLTAVGTGFNGVLSLF